MSSLPLCVEANLIIRLVADPKDAAIRQMWEQWDADGRLGRAVQHELPWVHVVEG